MRIYERLEGGEVEGKEEETRERKRIKAGIHLLGSHMPSPFSLPLLPPLLFLWLLGVFYHHGLFILNSSVCFFSSVICQKTFFLNHFQTHALCVSPPPPPPFLLHFPPRLSIILAVKTLYICSLTRTLCLSASTVSNSLHPFFLPFTSPSLYSNNSHIILQNPQSSSKHAPASYKRKNKSRCRLTHTNMFPE